VPRVCVSYPSAFPSFQLTLSGRVLVHERGAV
jgi:hypothetical protein